MNAPVETVAFALDANFASIAWAAKQGAQLLVTHHPVHLALDEDEEPSAYQRRILAHAAQSNMALISAHTNLDISDAARRSLGDAFVAASKTVRDCGPLPRFDSMGTPSEEPGFAELWELEAPLHAKEIARLYLRRFGHAELVDGGDYTADTSVLCGSPQATAEERRITRVVTATGSGSGAIDDAVRAGADLLVTGELSYHHGQEALERGLAYIELGHDGSERPLVEILRDTLRKSDLFAASQLVFMPPRMLNEARTLVAYDAQVKNESAFDILRGDPYDD